LFSAKFSNEELEKNDRMQEALREITILKKLNHDNIIKLNEILHDEKDIIFLSKIKKLNEIYKIIVLELIPNGALLHIDEIDDEVVINKAFKNEKFQKFDFSEDELRDLSRDIISGLHYSK
jgi:serine/threonine protein kinase